MKKYFLSAAAALLLFSHAMQAQQSVEVTKPQKEKAVEKNKDKLKEYDEIIIKRKDSNKDSKVTIEIRNDEVIVDGKPIDEFVDEQISVQKRNRNMYSLTAPSSQFRFEDGDWSDDEEMEMPEQDRAPKPFLGVTTEGSTGGTRIINVSENSAAAKAGLQKDDIITKVNDKNVFDQEQLSQALSAFKPNDKVTITYKRGGKENKTTATLGKRERVTITRGPVHPPVPPVPPMIFNFEDGELGHLFQNPMGKPRLGIKVQDTEDGKGVKVLQVEEGSAAEKSGIREDDIITSFEGKDVNSAGELAKASRESKEKSSIKVELKRNGKPQTIEVKVPKKLKTANL
jgi:serine protease Do